MTNPLTSNYVAGSAIDDTKSLAVGTRIVSTTLTADLATGEVDKILIADGGFSEKTGTLVVDDEIIYYHVYDQKEPDCIIDLLRAQEETVIAAHSSGAAVVIYGAPRYGNPAIADSIITMQEHIQDLESRLATLEALEGV